MRINLITLPSIAVLLILAGCAAAITKSENEHPSVIQGGSTREDLIQRFGSPTKSVAIATPMRSIALWEVDHSISVLLPNEIATNEARFLFRGRLDKQARAGQAGFDSFMTLGLAELFLIPKALWERTTNEELNLTVWFGSDGRALAYKWSEVQK